MRSLLRAKGEMGEREEGVREVQCTLGGSSLVGRTRSCAERKCEFWTCCHGVGLPKAPPLCHRFSGLGLVPGPRGDCSVIREESREEQVGRPAGRRRTDDAWVMQHWAGAQETGAQCGSPFQGKGSFLSVKGEIKRLSSPCV